MRAAEVERRRTPTRWVRPRHVVAGTLAIALVSMWVAPTTINFDPWSWLVWGREITAGDLDTTGGPSWKPLPVLVTVPLSVFGDGAPALWMLLARTGGLLMMVVVAVLAARLASSATRPGLSAWIGGVSAAAFVILTPDPEPRWFRTVFEGHSAPLAAGFTTWAIERHLAGRYRWAWGALVAAALIRPEVWPFLGLYGIWLLGPLRPRLRRGRSSSPQPVLVNRWGSQSTHLSTRTVVGWWVAVAVAWFGGDYWGSGSPWHGADVAQVGPTSLGERWSLVVDVTTEMVPVVVWVLAAAALVGAGRRFLTGVPGPVDRPVLAVGGLAAAWAGIVVVLTLTLGYAAISRFLLPVAALLCVLAAVGLARLVVGLAEAADVRARAGRIVLAVLVVAAAWGSASRVTGLSTVWAEIRDRGERAADLDRAVDAALDASGRDQILACGRPTITEPGLRSQLAWLLEVPLHRTAADRSPTSSTVAFVERDTRSAAAVVERVPDGPTVLAETRYWLVVAVDCNLG